MWRECVLARPVLAQKRKFVDGFRCCGAVIFRYPSKHNVGVAHALKPLFATAHNLDVHRLVDVSI